MHVAYQGGDPADYPQSSVGFDYDAVEESLHESRYDSVDRHSPIINLSPSEALFKFIAFLIDSSDYLLKLDVAIAAIGIPIYQGISYTELATKHTISKQAFDKHVLRFQKDFRLPITRAQKSPAARMSYKKTQLERQKRLLEKKQQQQERQINYGRIC